MIDFINNYLIPGLILGSIYGMGAIGVSLIFGVMRFATFAHGEMLMLGAYIAYTLVVLTGVHPFVAMVPAMIITAAAMLGIDRLAFKPLRGSPAIMLVIASFGVMLMVRSVVQLIWGVNAIHITTGIQPPMRLLGGNLVIAPNHVSIIIFTVILMVLVHLVLNHTRVGKAMRAMSDNPTLARLTGINTEHITMATWALGTALAAAAGVFLAVDTQLTTHMGFKMLLPMFASAILGGIGRPFGAVVGGLIIGVVEESSSFPLFGDAPLISPNYKTGIAFAIMVLMLLVRPSGLFKGSVFK